MSMDKYGSFNELAQKESDFTITCCDRGSELTILATHGGNIEPLTSDIAADIAGNEYNLYTFAGTKPAHNRDLHLTSHNFDEKTALALVEKSVVVITIHGCIGSGRMMYIGGRDLVLGRAIFAECNRLQIPATFSVSEHRGTHPGNICNRSARGMGVQLEISQGLRADEVARKNLIGAVRNALAWQQARR